MFEKLDEEWTKRYAQIGPEPKRPQGGGVKEQRTEGCGQIQVQPGTKAGARVRTKPGLDPRDRTTDPEDLEDPEDPEDPEDHREESRARTQDVAMRGCCSICESLKQRCPRPRGLLNLLITKACLFALLFGVVWSVTGSECLPGGNLFGLVILFICSVLGGKLMGLVQFPTLPPFPPLLGMLLAGLVLRNVPYITDAVYIDPHWSSALRNIALAIILTRAGLGLNPQALIRLKAVCVRLAVGPCLVEASVVALVSHFLLKLPWVWGFILGFVLAAVSPAVVVPSMLLLQREGYGVEKGIPTLLMAAGSFDDILAITGFSTCLGIAFSTGSTWMNVLKGLLEVVGGIVAGLVVGLFLCLFPSSDQEDLTWTRSLMLLGLSIFSVFLSHVVEFAGAGGLCVLVLSFCAALGWRVHKAPVAAVVGRSWDVFQPLLFGLIGAEITITTLSPSTVGLGVACLCIGLFIRVLVTFLLVHFGGFTLKEKLFIAVAWLPKATVQAAIGSKALDMAREKGDQVLEKYGLDVLTLAVLAILITAPIGALGIGLSGPRLLQQQSPEEPETGPPPDSTCVSEKDGVTLESKL